MRRSYLLILIVSTVLFSCKKERGVIPDPPAPEPSILLKDVAVERLPSPYYHFEYDSLARISSVSFASGFTMYNVVYAGNRITEMRNNTIANKDRLLYVYDSEGRIIAVNYADSTGSRVYRRIVFTYDGKKLIESTRLLNTDSGFVIEKTMTFTYYGDDNLKEISYDYLPLNGQPEARFSDLFEKYDNKTNVDGFGLIHNDFFDHLILLPGIHLQRNNPGKETRTGDGENYTVDYTYIYDEKDLPLRKNGEGIVSKGSNTGLHFQPNSVYTYY